MEFPEDINGFEYEIREASKCAREGKTSNDYFSPPPCALRHKTIFTFYLPDFSDYAFFQNLSQLSIKRQKPNPKCLHNKQTYIGIYNLGFLYLLKQELPKSFTSKVHMNEYGTDDYSDIELVYQLSIKRQKPNPKCLHNKQTFFGCQIIQFFCLTYRNRKRL